MVDHRLFARYVYAPNSLGYCGPADAAVLESVACGAAPDVDLTSIARKFSGAWPYQQIVADFAGVADPLDDSVVRAYWTGNDITERIDGLEFGRMLLDRFAPHAGHYWKYLTDDLLDEAAPTHIFHVLGVYPWTRLLHDAAPQALHVLDSCRITPASVVSIGPAGVVVRARGLEYDGQLSLGDEHERQVRYRFAEPLAPGDFVAVHWDFVCDRLSAEDVERLSGWTRRQCERTNKRLHLNT